MSELVLPDVVVQNAELERAVERVKRVREREAYLGWFEDELRSLDRRLSLVKATDRAVDPLLPGFWHVKRDNGDGTPDTYLPIQGPDGEFLEPHSGVLESLRKADLWRRDVLAELREREERERREREQARLVGRDERVDEIAGRIKAATNPGVSFSDVPWTLRKKRRG